MRGCGVGLGRPYDYVVRRGADRTRSRL